MKNRKKLQIKKETVEILKRNSAQQLKGGCSIGDITVQSRTCGDVTKDCTISCNCQSQVAGTCNTDPVNCPQTIENSICRC